MRRTAMLKPVLLILHQEHSSPGRVGQVLGKLGYPLDIRRPRFGDPLPETMDEHAGAAFSAARKAPTTTRSSYAARSTGSACRCATRSRISASASAHR